MSKDSKNKKETINYPNGDIYEGETLNGKKHGHGKMTYAGGDEFDTKEYNGEWKDDLICGHGVEKLVGGSVVEGEYKDGKLNGHGIMKWADGYVYDGEYIDGKLNDHEIYKRAVVERKCYGTLTLTAGKKQERQLVVRPYIKKDNSIEFGSYPQTKVTDDFLIYTLNKKTDPLPTSNNPNKWTSYKYYIEGKEQEYMWYIDIEEGENKYRGVYFTQYRPNSTVDESSKNNSNQYYNKYKFYKEYWFKYEPIKWTIVEESNGYATLISDIVIDSQEFYSDRSDRSHSHNGGEGYSNNYALSNIRKWLNETFYNTAFSEKQKSIIQTTEVDNGTSSTFNDTNTYLCENTNDKIYLLSSKESEKYFTSDIARQKKGSDYEMSQGGSGGRCDWWLRLPYYNLSNRACYVDFEGEQHVCYVDYTNCGVVPALKIKL